MYVCVIAVNGKAGDRSTRLLYVRVCDRCKWYIKIQIDQIFMLMRVIAVNVGRVSIYQNIFDQL